MQKNYLLEISPRGGKHGVKLLLQSKNHIYNQHINGKMHEVLIHFKSIVPTELKTMPWIDEWTVERLIEKQTLLQELNFQVTFLAMKRFNEAGVAPAGILNWTFYSRSPFAWALYSMHWDRLKLVKAELNANKQKDITFYSDLFTKCLKTRNDSTFKCWLSPIATISKY